MAIDSKHPHYVKYFPDWEMLRDFYEGADKVREQGEKYLPATEGMRLDGLEEGKPGHHAYRAYRLRARVPDYVKEAVEVLVGLMHQKDAIIELPSELEYLREKASAKGEPLAALHRRINVEQITTGRLGLLGEMSSNPSLNNQPYLALYTAESIINWDDESPEGEPSKLNLVVLDESGHKRNEHFNWEFVNRYRVLTLNNDKYAAATFDSDSGMTYDVGRLTAPVYRGTPLEEIPFTFVNSKDLLPEPDEPPLKGLAEMCKGIYQSEADYRQNLYMQAQDTLVVIGGLRNPNGLPEEPDAIRVGAGSRIDVDTGGDAKYIGVSADGLMEQRIAIENDRKRAQVKAGELIQNTGSQMESGQALSTRFNAQTATLNQLATTAAAGLANALKQIARWIGADPEKVKVTPNTEFIDFSLNGAEFKAIMDAKKLGFPVSYESLHALAADRGITIMDYVTEMQKISVEDEERLKVEIERAKKMMEAMPAPEPGQPGQQGQRPGGGNPSSAPKPPKSPAKE